MINPLIQLSPKSIIRTLYSFYIWPIKKVRKKQSVHLPVQNIGGVHIENLKTLVNRVELLKRLPINGVIAELGVDEGRFSKMIVDICNPQKYHLVDIWGMGSNKQDKKRLVENLFKNEIEKGQVEINSGLSIKVVNEFQENYFDWIYIDTDHSYKTTIQELEAYRSKVKENGIIAGHDFIIGNWDGMVRYGAIEAVHEFCIKYHWEILYLTAEIDTHPSFAIRKIQQ